MPHISRYLRIFCQFQTEQAGPLTSKQLLSLFALQVFPALALSSSLLWGLMLASHKVCKR